MTEEEPMDISLEDSFHGNSGKTHLNATIATTSPSRKERKHISSFEAQYQYHTRNIDIPKLQRQIHKEMPFQSNKIYGSPQSTGKTYTRIRNMGKKQNSPPKKRRRSDDTEECDEGEDKKKSLRAQGKKKSGIFYNNSGKMGLWIVLIAAFFVLRFGIHFQSCSPKFDLTKLHSGLQQYVFGQHIASGIVETAFQMYFNHSAQRNHTDIAPFVLSFHGWTGVGKNLITSIIVNSFSKQRVQMFLVPLHFADPLKNSEYASKVPIWVKSNITLCNVNIFIFDEIDKAPSGVIQGLHDVIVDLRNLHLNETWVIFLLLSNSRGGSINKKLFSEVASGKTRDSITMEDIIPVITDSSEDEWYGKLLKDNIIDQIVPFLPLTYEHVKLCIKRDVLRKQKKFSENVMNSVLEELNFFTPQDQSEKYSYTGCKRVSDKVDLHLSKNEF
ncbi:hypothetical protein FSP39_024589 [Pinctada imbricata]|uniref:Torsin-1A C-terminal domain-containing protein n=1 Tax=Pinctada imbricata TaxID=66713 RepID=A0AA88YEZ2_PINIB|nr:hypothetical protein FSP39_024589 [Pinctada imbricata]